MTLRVVLGLALGCALAPAAAGAQAQPTHDELEIARLEGTPIGALPPLALPMPASRNHNYWGIRLQGGARDGRQGSDLAAYAAGVDFQFRGGSVYGVTAGYQERDCRLVGVEDCGGHTLFGARARINLMTGGPTIGALFRDYSATSTLGTEIGFGYAPGVLEGMDACTLDMGIPMSVAMGQRVRVATFITPGVVWDMGCGPGSPTHPSYLTGLGVGLQQLRNRGFDIYFGIQKIFRANTGYQLGVSVTYVRLP